MVRGAVDKRSGARPGQGARRVLAGLVAATGMVLAATSAGADTISLRADSWCPYNCQPGSDKPGYMIEIATEVFAAAGHTVDYQLLPWTRALEEVQHGTHQGAVGATREDAEGLLFGDEPLGVSVNALGARRGYTFSFSGPDSLKGHRLLAVQDYAYSDELDAYIAANAGTDAVALAAGDDVTLQNLRKVLAERADLMLEDRNVLEYTATSQGMEGLIDIHPAGKGLPLYIAFSPTDPKGREYARILDEGVRKLRASGRLREILARYGLDDWSK